MELPGLNKPSSKVPSSETKVVPSGSGWSWEMVLVSEEILDERKSRLAMIMTSMNGSGMVIFVLINSQKHRIVEEIDALVQSVGVII